MIKPESTMQWGKLTLIIAPIPPRIGRLDIKGQEIKAGDCIAKVEKWKPKIYKDGRPWLKEFKRDKYWVYCYSPECSGIVTYSNEQAAYGFIEQARKHLGFQYLWKNNEYLIIKD